MTDIIDRLQDPDFRNEMQHLRSWSELDKLHDDATAEIKRLQEVVQFYADAKNWNDGYFKNDEPGVLELVPSSVRADHGKKARQALGIVKETAHDNG